VDGWVGEIKICFNGQQQQKVKIDSKATWGWSVCLTVHEMYKIIFQYFFCSGFFTMTSVIYNSNLRTGMA
jgi:hypothetical protein